MSKFRNTFSGRSLRYVIYLTLLISVAAPLLAPIGLPVPITGPTRDLYNGISAIPAGSNVMYAPDLTAGNAAEVLPICVAILQHLYSLPVRVVIVTFVWDESVSVLTSYILPKVNPGNRKYGQDWVNLGYIAGAEVSMAAFAQDVQGVAPRDYYGSPTKDMPIMEKIRTAKDFSDVIVIAASPVSYYLRQFQSPYGIKMGAPTVGPMYPTVMAYYTAGQVFGTANGLRGAAEYEILRGKPGDAVSSTDSISTAHILIILFVVAGNVQYFYGKYNQRRIKK